MSFDFLIDSLFRDPFVLWYCIGILVFFLVVLVRLLWVVAALGRVLRRSRDALPYDGDRPRQFFHMYDEYQSTMEEDLGTPWRQFSSTLILPADGSESWIQSPHTASTYLNSSTVAPAGAVFGLSQSMPNLLTGVGILGTFIGLAAGVGEAHSGLSSGTPDEITASLQQLLGGASLAFLTSIFGIGLSIAFLLISRYASHRLAGEIDEWVNRLESCFVRITSEETAVEQQKLLRDVAKGIKQFNTDLVFALEKALDWPRGAVSQREELPALSKKIADGLSPKLGHLAKKMEELRKDRATDAGGMIEGALSRFTEAMQGRTGSQFNKMAEVVTALNDTLEESSNRMADSQRGVREALDLVVRRVTASMNDGAAAMIDALKQSLTAVTSDLENASRRVAASMTDSSDSAAKKLRDTVVSATEGLAETGVEAASRITGSTKALEDAAENLSEASRRNREVLDEAAMFVEQLNQLRDTIEGAHESISDLAAPVGRAAHDIRESTDRTGRTLTEVTGLVSLIDEAVDKLGRHEEAVAQAWGDYRERFEGIDKSLADIFRQIDDGLSRYCEQVKQFANELDDKTARTVQHLAAAIHELDQSIEDLTNHRRGGA